MDQLTGINDTTLKNLGDRSVEKRKLAGQELKASIEKLLAENQLDQINKRIEVFTKMVISSENQHGSSQQSERDNPGKRRSGLYGLSQIAVTLYNRRLVEHLDKILPPITRSFGDKDIKVQQAACDAMFNIVKSCKESILRYKHFLDIFGRIIDLIGTSVASTDVKEYAKKVDDQLKDVVYRSLDKGLKFDLDQLIDAICEKLKASINKESQIVLIKWIETLHSITNVNILNCVPRFLFKLFTIVEGHFNDKLQLKTELGKKSLDQLDLFLADFQQQQSRSLELDKEIIVELNRFLKDQPSQQQLIGKGHYEALCWLSEFINYFEQDYNLWLTECKDLLEAPENQLTEEERQIKRDQKTFMKEMYQHQFPDIIEIILIYIQRKQFQGLVQEINQKLLQLVLNIMKDKNDFDNILNKLRNEFKGNKSSRSQGIPYKEKDQANTREIVVNWYIMLFKNFDTDLINQNQDIYVKVIDNIDFNYGNLVKLQIELICMLSVKNEAYFRHIMRVMIQRVNMHKKEFNQEKINQIINCLCNSIKPEKVFMEFATIFQDMTDLHFVQDMIETLTFAISSSPFYKALRGKLFGTVPTDFAKDREELFTHLFNSWCINPISTLTLCLLSQKYELAYNLLNHLSDELDSKKLIQLGTLVQLIESPSFVQLRLQLMKQTEENKYLIKTLQGILMILPQSKTFSVLKTRLDCVNITNFSLPFVSDEQLLDENGDPQETPEALALRQKQKEQEAIAKRKAIIECLKQFERQQERYGKYIHDQLMQNMQRQSQQASGNGQVMAASPDTVMAQGAPGGGPARVQVANHHVAAQGVQNQVANVGGFAGIRVPQNGAYGLGQGAGQVRR